MAITLPVALLALAALQQQTDTTVPVPEGARLRVDGQAGIIHVTAWERRELRVRAEHGSRDQIEVRVRGSLVTVAAERWRGRPPAVNYDITVPRGMAVDLGGVETDVSIDGPVGDVHATSVEGGISVRGAIGAVSVTTVEGEIVVEGGRGRVQVTGTDGSVRLKDVQGEVTVETVDGDVTLDNIDSDNVDASSVDGTVTYQGTIKDNGRYRFSSHDGDVVLRVAQAINAAVSVATFDGSFEADPVFRVQLTQQRRGHRFSFVLGSGSARLELESFDGAIRLLRR